MKRCQRERAKVREDVLWTKTRASSSIIVVENALDCIVPRGEDGKVATREDLLQAKLYNHIETLRFELLSL